jgi:phage gpG-like protein
MAEIQSIKRFSTSIRLPGVALKVSGIDSINSKAARLIQGLNSSRSLIAEKLKDALDQALESSVWSGGGREDSDLVDSGRLKNSGSVVATEKGISIRYDAPYAALIHYGGYILPYGNKSTEKVYIPPRPWIQSVIRGGGPVPQFDFAAVMREALRRVLG